MDLRGQLASWRQDQGPDATRGAGPHPAVGRDQKAQGLAGAGPEVTTQVSTIDQGEMENYGHSETRKR